MQTVEPQSSIWQRLEPRHKVKLIFFGAAFASFIFSVSLWFGGEKEAGLFVGLWVPAIHSLGTLVLVGERDER